MIAKNMSAKKKQYVTRRRTEAEVELDRIYLDVLNMAKKYRLHFNTVLSKIVRKHGYTGFSMTHKQEEPNP